MTYREMSVEDQNTVLRNEVEELKKRIQVLEEKALNARWEYTTIERQLVTKLAALGSAGWEIVCQDGGNFDWMLKRRLP